MTIPASVVIALILGVTIVISVLIYFIRDMVQALGQRDMNSDRKARASISKGIDVGLDIVHAEHERQHIKKEKEHI